MSPHSTLPELQRWMRWVITDPRGPRAALASSQSEPLPRQLDALAGDRINRLGVYADAYFIRLSESLASDFRTVARSLGGPAFRRVVADYLLRYPSHSPHIGDLGSQFAHFLESHICIQSHPFLSDLARLEWAALQSLYQTRLPAPDTTSWSRMPVDAWPLATLELDPTVQLLGTAWAVDRLWEDRGQPEGKGHTQLSHPEPRWLVVYRDEEWIQVLPMTGPQWFALDRFRSGATLDKVCSDLVEFFPKESEALPLMQWFAEWMRCGVIKGVQFSRDDEKNQL